MSIQKLPTKKIICFFTALIIIAGLILSFVYNRIATKELHNIAVHEIEKIQEQLEAAFEDSIEESEDDLSLLASYVAKNTSPHVNIIDFLNSQSHVEEFENLYFVTVSGHGVSTDNVERDFSKNPVFLSALHDKFIISTPYKSLHTGEIVLDIAVPVIKNKKVIAVLFSEHSIENLYQRMQDLMKDTGYAYIINKKGNIIYSTTESFTRLEDIEDDKLNILNDRTVEEIKDDIKDGQSDILYYEVNGEKITSLYVPIKSADWILVLSIEENKIHTTLYSAVSLAIQIGLLSIFIIIVFTFYMWYTSKLEFIKSIEKTAYTDVLTGLPNLACLKKDMLKILKENKNKQFTIVKTDIENFKAINELFSFETGNSILKTFKKMTTAINEPTLLVARTGVDEFMFFFRNDLINDIDKVTRRYEAYFKRIMPKLGRDYHLSFKYGRYCIAKGETNVDNIINYVNMAHSMAKEQKGHKMCDYDDSYKERILEDIKLSNKMKNALKNNEFKTYLQPKICVKSGGIIGAEALVRWIEPDGNIMFPDRYIPLFEKNGFVVQIDRHMLEGVCIILRSWKDQGFGYLPVSVNLSRLNLREPNLAATLTKIVDKYAIPHEYIEFELTESTMIDNEDILESLFSDLHKHNYKISIDDFGAGYSSLSLLKNLSADTIKLDKRFFQDKKNFERGMLIVDAIIKLAQSLNMYVIVEGIEHAEQIDIVRKSGGDAVQGYFFAKPMDTEGFTAKYGQEMRANAAQQKPV